MASDHNIQTQATCTICNKLFRNVTGLNIHSSKVHQHEKLNLIYANNASTLETNTLNTTATSGLDSSKIDHNHEDSAIPHLSNSKCKYCGKQYKNVNSHITRSHPEIYRQTITDNYNNTVPATCSSTPKSKNDADLQRQSPNNNIEKELDLWNIKFNKLLEGTPNKSAFDSLVDDFITFLKNSSSYCKGPEHPAVKYYKARKAWKSNPQQSSYSKNKNPQRHDKRKREQRQNQYRYDLMQHYYYYRRRKAVQQIMAISEGKRCLIPASEIVEFYSSTMGTENSATLPEYPHPEATDEDDIFQLSETDIIQAMKGINLDTAPGPDHIFFKVVKELNCSKIIMVIANIMLLWNYVPKSLRLGRTILIYKTGDPNIITNWRPITIYSIIRRIIERAIGRKLRPYVELSSCQRGFTSTPGTFINSSLVNSCLQKAKKDKTNCVVTFLDVSKAFDSIGHKHIELCLNSTSAPKNLKSLILSLITNNSVKIDLNATTRTTEIPLHKGVAQGSPLSPLLFNMAIDFIFKELNDNENAQKFGYHLLDNVENISALGFADDIALISTNVQSAAHMIETANQCLQQIGLKLNSEKSKAIIIKNGKLQHIDILTLSGLTIKSIDKDEKIKYLGVTYNDEIILDKTSIINNLNNSISKLVTTPFLKPDQKLNILNQYIWPSLIYPLQCAPLSKLKNKFLEDIDKLIKSAVKEIIGLPSDTPDSMIYSSRRLRGLGVIKCTWEAYLQHINICNTLRLSSDPLIHRTRNFETEIQESLHHLSLTPTAQPNVRKLRKSLRDEQYSKWKNLPHHGRGVSHFSEWSKANTWISTKKGLSSSQWTNALKMNCNLIPVRSIPGRSRDSHCRHCNEFETLPHVLGFCPRGELLRNNRHHKVRSCIAKLLRQSGNYEVYEEVPCISSSGSTRRADIVAIHKKLKLGYILDPTIRFEKNIIIK